MNTLTTIELIKKLRERTGVAVSECKKALEKSGGDIEEAIQRMREEGTMKAASRSDRVADEGAVVCQVSPDGSRGLMIELNCETDFVGKSDVFIDFLDQLLKIGLMHQVSTLDELLNCPFDDQLTVAQMREQLVLKIGENIQIRRCVSIQAIENQRIGMYVHGRRIGVLVVGSASGPSSDEHHIKEVLRDVSMHIAACHPLFLCPEDVSESLIEKERLVALSSAEGKPEAVIEKIVSGRLTKYRQEVSLMGQIFVKDAQVHVGEWLKRNHVAITRWARFELGQSELTESQSGSDAV